MMKGEKNKMSKKFKNKKYYCDGVRKQVSALDPLDSINEEAALLFLEKALGTTRKKENRCYYKPMLTLEEREFLKHVVRPFRDVIKYISIQPADIFGKEFLSIAYLADTGTTRYITFPMFDEYRQYKGLERGVKFRLNDLDL